MNSVGRDFRFALRQLRKTPGFTATAVLTLAFGIGATTAIFSIVEGVLLRPLPFADPHSLVVVGDMLQGADLSSPQVPAPEAVRYMRETHSFSSLGVYRQTVYELSGQGNPAQVSVARLSAGTFTTLGVSPLMGRTFTPGEDEGHEQLAVLSYQTWRSRFHGDAQILGAKIELDRRPYQVIGVMPRSFEFPLVPGQLNRTELWIPMSFTASELGVQGQGSWNFNMVGRLKPGVSAAQAQQDEARVTEDIIRAFPAAMAGLHLTAAVVPLDQNTLERARPLVRTLFLAVIVVLFIACANLAGLLLVRVIRRRREIAVRLALGASGSTVVRQSLIETISLSLGGGLLGLTLAAIAIRVGISLLPETLPRVDSIGLNWMVVVFSIALALITGLLCGLLPALAAARTGVNDALKEGGRTGTSGAGHARWRSALVVAEIAVALVLLTGAGLLLRSFEKLRSVDLGFRADHVLTASYSLPAQQYSTQAAVDTFNDAVLSRLAQLPGVQAVGTTSALPAAGNDDTSGFVPEGYSQPSGVGLNSGWSSQIIGDYFQAAGIPLLRGRLFNQADRRPDAPLVVIVNRNLADHYWPGQDPIGKRLHIGVHDTPLPWMTVVGEIGDIKQGTADAPVRPQFYIPSAQFKRELGMFASPEMKSGDYGSLVLRSSLPPEQMEGALRSVVHSLDPQLPLTQVESMDRVVSEGQAPRRFNAMLISSFAGAAVLLAVLGIYSVIAFSATLRTHEMAIRLALGSQRSSVMRLILVSAARLGLSGCAIGLVAAFFATRLLRSMLFEVDPLDPMVMSVAAAAIFALALLASVLPARRAASVEPMQALRSE